MSKETDALLYHPEVLKVIKAVLRSKGLGKEQDLEDGVHSVCARVLVRVNRLARRPETIAEWKAVCRVIAETTSIDRLRKNKVDRKHNAGLTDESDEHGELQSHGRLEEIDARRAWLEFERMAADGDLPPGSLDLIDALAADTKQSDYAKETQQPHVKVRKQRVLIAKLFGDRLSALGMIDIGINRLAVAAEVVAVAVCAVLLVLYLPRLRGFDPTPLAHDPNAPSPDAGKAGARDNVPEPTVVVDTAAQKRLELTLEAESALKKKDWNRCIGSVEAAAMIDAGTDAVPTGRLSAIYTTCLEGSERNLNSKVPVETPKKEKKR